MRLLVIIVGLLLIVGHILTEAYMIVWKADERTVTEIIHPFKGNPEQEITVLWYMKMFFDELLWCITYGTFAIVAKRYSKVLFAIVVVFFFYHVSDFCLFVYNYKNVRGLYIAMLIIDVMAILYLIFSKEKETKYKSLL